MRFFRYFLVKIFKFIVFVNFSQKNNRKFAKINLNVYFSLKKPDFNLYLIYKLFKSKKALNRWRHLSMSNIILFTFFRLFSTFLEKFSHKTSQEVEERGRHNIIFTVSIQKKKKNVYILKTLQSNILET